MANEILTLYSESATLYAVIRKQSDLKIYNASSSSFEDFNASNWSDYAIDLTQSDDVYSVDHPDIDNDSYIYTIYKQDGASPAVSDSRIDGWTGQWNSTDITPISGDVILSGYALCTADQLKRELGITGNTYNNEIKQIINSVSSYIENYTGRKFKSRNYVEFTRFPSNIIILNNYPILKVNKIATSLKNAFSIQYTGSGIEATASIVGEKFYIYVYDSNGVETSYSFDLSTYKSVSALKTQVDSTTSDITFTVKNNVLTKWLIPTAGLDIKNNEVYFDYVYSDDTSLIVNESEGIIDLSTGEKFRYIAIDYDAGYETLPYDINMAAINISKNLYSLIGGYTSLKSASLDSYSYSLGDLTDELTLNILKSYRNNPVVASTTFRG